MAIHDSIVEALRASHGSLEDPSWHFTTRALERGRYTETIEKLKAAGFQVEETTDLNYDVARCLSLARGPLRMSLDLSLAGPFALLLTPGADGIPCFPAAPDPEVASILTAAGISVLDRAQLEATIPFGQRAAPTTVHRLLFYNLDRLSWEPPA